ncbi:hypothetical protein [Microcoleus sp. CAWBG58]|uniref:hypothetical protein n=1 Tax=Microcoleus sp. CAWBG58 TaxID=2841651 RepID=UPI0025D21061|nr:hypothetical protein [Microcoleus sp. CAWBG58]
MVESRNYFNDNLKSDYSLLQSPSFFCQLSTVNCQLSTDSPASPTRALNGRKQLIT